MFQDADLRKSITCSRIPEAFLNKTVAKDYFSQFGTIKNFSIRPKRFVCTVEYETINEAELAKNEGGLYNGATFDIEFTPNEVKPPTPDPEMDPDVKSELQALRELSRSATAVPSTITPSPRPMTARSGTGLQDDLKKEIETMANKQAATVEEKYRLLDARDKLMRKLMQSSAKNLNKSKYVIGTCPDMCPEKERLMREFQNQIPIFELADDTNHMDHSIAIKQYSRSSADQEVPLPQELRPEKVLKMTMSYLLHYIVDMLDEEDSTTNVSDWFHFVWDRMRSIRKDITQQDLCSAETVQLVEKCARFHIHCSARLIEQDPSVFDSKLNTENLTKCLQTLKYMYDDLRLHGVACPNEAEFRGYVVLLNLNNTNFMWEFKHMPDSVLNAKPIRFALEVYSAISNCNYVRFFNLVRETNYLNACILLRYFTQVRYKAMYQIVKAFTPRNQTYNMPLELLVKVMGFENDEALSSFLEYYGLVVNEESNTVQLDRSVLYDPDVPFPPYLPDIVDSKLTTSLSEVLGGEEMDTINDFLDHDVYVSFTDDGYLNQEVVDELYGLLKEQKTVNASEKTLFKVPSLENLSPKVAVKKKALPTAKTKVQQIIKPSKIVREKTKDVPDYVKPPLVSSVAPMQQTAPSIFKLGQVVKAETPTKQVTPQDIFSAFPKASSTATVPPFSSGGNIFGKPSSSSTSIFGQQIAKVEPKPASISKNFFFVPTQSQPQPLSQRSQPLPTPVFNEITPIIVQPPLPKARDEPLQSPRVAPLELPKQVIDENFLKDRERKLSSAASNQLDQIVGKVVSTQVKNVAINLVDDLRRQQELESKQIYNEVLNDLISDEAQRVCNEEELVNAIIEARRIRLQYRVVNKWLKYKNRNQLRKKQLENAPLYTINETLHENAVRFAMPGCRDFLNSSHSLDVDQKIWSSKTINLLDMVAKKRDRFMDDQYWKGVIVVADEAEAPEKKVKPLQKWLRRTFGQDDASSDTLFKGQVYIRNDEYELKKHKIVACLTQTSGENFDESTIESSCGVIFVVHAGFIRPSQRRFQRLLSALETVEASVAIVVTTTSGTKAVKIDKATVVKELNLDDLGDCKVFIESQSLPLFKCFESALDDVIDPFDNTYELEMDVTAELLSKCIGQELWFRLKNASLQNVTFLIQTKDPAFVFELFNEAVNRTSCIFDLEMTHYRKRAKEFEEFVEGAPTLPLKFSSFPEEWTTIPLSKVVEFLCSMRIPIPSITNTEDVELIKYEVQNYIVSLFPQETALRLTQAVYLELIQNPLFSWVSIARRICTEYCDTQWRKTGGSLPEIVPYNQVVFHEYLNVPWYLNTTHSRKLDLSFNSSLDSSLNQSRKRKTSKNEDSELNGILQKSDQVSSLFEERLKPFYHSLENFEVVKRIKVLIEQTDASLEVATKKSKEFENYKFEDSFLDTEMNLDPLLEID